MVNKHAQVAWTLNDILELRPEWTKEKAENWLRSNSKDIQDGMIEKGWEVIEVLLYMERETAEQP